MATRRAIQRLQVVRIRDVLHEPVVRLETRADILRERQLRFAFDADLVVVVKPQQLVQPEMSRQRSGFRRDAFHHIAIAADCVAPCVD